MISARHLQQHWDNWLTDEVSSFNLKDPLCLQIQVRHLALPELNCCLFLLCIVLWKAVQGKREVWEKQTALQTKMASKAALGPPPSLNKALPERLSPCSPNLATSCRSPTFFFSGLNKTQDCYYLTLVSHIKLSLLVQAIQPFFASLFPVLPQSFASQSRTRYPVTWLLVTII